MKAVVYHTNVMRGMYSAILPDGSFSVFELVDPRELDMYTEVSGDFEAYGDREIFYLDDKLHVHIDHYGLNEMAAFSKTFLRE